MNVTIAIDSMKGSLTSKEAGEAAKCGVLKVFPDANVFVRTVADGGEGTDFAVVSALDGNFRTIEAANPFMNRINASYGIADKTAIIEISAVAGITLVPNSELNPLFATTYGVGEMIKDAISLGIRDFIIGLGGSATNDGGAGMLSALGYKFLDKNGDEIKKGAIGLADLSSIDISSAIPELSECSFSIACDVTNPLCGENGCSRVFAPQKGATPEMIEDMDLWLSRYADITNRILPNSDKNTAGAGAAGGLGFAFLSYLSSKLCRGIDLIIEKTRLEEYIKKSDIVITGEGRLDAQTVMGKTPIGVARLAKKHNKPVIAFSGCVTQDAVLCNDCGIDAFFPIVRGAVSLADAMDTENAKINMESAVRQVFNIIKCFKQ